jgi:hypothetical protein
MPPWLDGGVCYFGRIEGVGRILSDAVGIFDSEWRASCLLRDVSLVLVDDLDNSFQLSSIAFIS